MRSALSRCCIITVVSASAGLFACTAILGATEVPTPSDGRLADGGIPPGDGSTNNGGDGESPDGTTGDGSLVDPYHHNMTDGSLWTFFDLTTFNANAKGFDGASLDGKGYLYLAPSNVGTSGLVARYNLKASFADATSWQVFDTSSINANTKGFHGAGFDGRFVYLAPFQNPANHGFTIRYDTQATFTDKVAWSPAFDMNTVVAGAIAFQGVASDGRYMYYTPNGSSTTPSGHLIRYDTKGGWSDAASWTTFDTTGVNAGARGFDGSVFDGRFLYLAPGESGMSLRYDTQAPFNVGTSYQAFDTATLNPGAIKFRNALFDGRHIYFVPNNAGAGSIIVRYDTQNAAAAAGFASATSWQTFDTTSIHPNAKGLRGGGFDGRFIYLAPNNNGVAAVGVIARYDIQRDFTSTASWQGLDLTTLNPAAVGFRGAAFDGRYLFLIPYDNGVMARFDARDPAQMPALAQFTGSFF